LHGLVVINDRYQSGRAVHRHAVRLTRLPHLEQSNFRLTEPYFRRLDLTIDNPGEKSIHASRLCDGLELVRHSDELGQGFSLHLFHHLAPMHFDSSFTGIEFCRNLLIKHPGNDVAHHLALPDA
jgi:hypothetical protein